MCVYVYVCVCASACVYYIIICFLHIWVFFLSIFESVYVYVTLAIEPPQAGTLQFLLP